MEQVSNLLFCTVCKVLKGPADACLSCGNRTFENGNGELQDLEALPISTLSFFPGYEVKETIGVVHQLSSASGFTAASKGNTALDRAMIGLSRTAIEMGANAILGLQATTFGAGGGITNAFGGDAVGVLLVGTAVKVAKLDDGR